MCVTGSREKPHPCSRATKIQWPPSLLCSIDWSHMERRELCLFKTAGGPGSGLPKRIRNQPEYRSQPKEPAEAVYSPHAGPCGYPAACRSSLTSQLSSGSVRSELTEFSLC